MSDGPSVVQHIDTVDSYARTLYLRAQTSPLAADAIRQLHVALRHLRIEASDPDSPLSSDSYTNRVQILPIVDECGASLRQLEGALDDGRRADQLAGTVRRLRERIDNFLDAVQLQGQASPPPPAARMNGGSQPSADLDDIKAKVDKVARTVFARRDSGFEDDDGEDRLWHEFQAQLENEGFSRHVLQNHKVRKTAPARLHAYMEPLCHTVSLLTRTRQQDVLRAYIRNLESMLSRDHGRAPPTVQGLLEYEARSLPPSDVVSSPVEIEKYDPFVKQQRTGLPPPVPKKVPLEELPASDDNKGGSNNAHHHPDSNNKYLNETTPPPYESTDLILTRDLVEMDSLDADVARHMSSSAPHQPQQLYGSPKQQRYLPPTTSAGGLLEAPGVAELSAHQQLSASPVYTAGPMALAAPTSFRLGPDRYGNEIPMDAQWTRISRDLVNPEVLERAGVRYEARRTYVAVLGRLTRDQVEDYARQTADCRAARHIRQHQQTFAQQQQQQQQHAPQEPRSMPAKHHDDSHSESDLWDSSDDDTDDMARSDAEEDKGTRSYPYIVSPPKKAERTSPASTVAPKSILKNKNENHVRFDPEPYEVSPRDSGTSLGSSDERRRRHRRDRERDHDREREYRRDDDSEEDVRRRRPRRYNSEGERRHRHHDEDGHSGRRHTHSGSRKKPWGGTLGAVGIGGVAVSLLSVLAEAAGG